MAKKVSPQKPARGSTVRMSKTIKAEIEKAAEKIERARIAAGESKQPRFAIDQKQMNDIFSRIYSFGKDAIFREPPYIADSRKRDEWLAKAVLQEPYLLGILQSVVSIDKNRGWNLVGGRNQVKRFVSVLHNFGVAPDLFGWRHGLSISARNYYQSDLGAVVEIGRTIPNGPLAGLFTVDSTQCKLTGNLQTPLQYGTAKKDNPAWSANDYFRVPSFPSPAEKMNGLGFCAVSRSLELAKLLVALFSHEAEKLGSKAPKGLLVINGVTQAQWLQSLAESDAERSVMEREYYSGVQTLANGDGGKDINVSLINLSELPADFDRQNFLNMIIFGYALEFGYDPREFWPVSSGGLGTATETESQHRRATSKGGLDFVLGFQEQLQMELPPTLQFEFEQRDVAGDLAESEYRQAELDIIRGMFESVNSKQENLITLPEARQLLVESELIPDEWTPDDEPQAITDTDDSGDDPLLERARVRAAMEKFKDEPIVAYNDRTGKTRTIYDPNKKKFSITMPAFKMRQYSLGDYENIRAEFQSALYDAVYGYLDSSDRATAYKSEIKQNIVNAYTPTVETGYMDGGSELPLDEDVNAFLTAAQGAELANVDSLFVSLAELRKDGELDIAAEANARADGYTRTLDGLYNKAVLYGLDNKMLTFGGVDGEESCATCQALQGQRHKASWWISHDYVPPTGAGLDCAAGGHCAHQLEDDDGNVWTR